MNQKKKVGGRMHSESEKDKWNQEAIQCTDKVEFRSRLYFRDIKFQKKI